MTLTERDLEYLRCIYVLGDGNIEVTPSMLALKLNISKVTAYQQMRRYEGMGLGRYERQKGFKLGREGRSMVEESIRRHHVIEHLLAEALDIPCKEACLESARIQYSLSDDFIELAFKRTGEPSNCECGCKISPPFDIDELNGCTWCQQSYGTRP